jgi:hypothetical protein
MTIAYTEWKWKAFAPKKKDLARQEYKYKHHDDLQTKIVKNKSNGGYDLYTRRGIAY